MPVSTIRTVGAPPGMASSEMRHFGRVRSLNGLILKGNANFDDPDSRHGMKLRETVPSASDSISLQSDLLGYLCWSTIEVKLRYLILHATCFFVKCNHGSIVIGEAANAKSEDSEETAS
ncbi:hypothetical protein JCGZ_03138 [Jatropha curcas]|uniref:Uncharacterized protein n=1 Tax=Jatropha curcas TaxID=180498 RepID=A0A067JGP9_JATCU|nr:hypothetical protein JCGZ_03138 [Jatropha curcas]